MDYTIEWLLDHEDRYKYQILDRMRMDCNYALGNGRIYGNHFWAGNEVDQIACMKALWNSFDADKKPEWLTWEKILEYEELLVTNQS